MGRLINITNSYELESIPFWFSVHALRVFSISSYLSTGNHIINFVFLYIGFSCLYRLSRTPESFGLVLYCFSKYSICDVIVFGNFSSTTSILSSTGFTIGLITGIIFFGGSIVKALIYGIINCRFLLLFISCVVWYSLITNCNNSFLLISIPLITSKISLFISKIVAWCLAISEILDATGFNQSIINIYQD